MSVHPERPARPRIERHHIVRPLRDVHDSIDNERRGLPVPDDRALVDPLQFEILGIGGVYLTQATMALTEIAAGVSQPIVRLLRRVEQTAVSHLRDQRA